METLETNGKVVCILFFQKFPPNHSQDNKIEIIYRAEIKDSTCGKQTLAESGCALINSGAAFDFCNAGVSAVIAAMGIEETHISSAKICRAKSCGVPRELQLNCERVIPVNSFKIKLALGINKQLYNLFR